MNKDTNKIDYLELRYRALANEYINNGFNITKAYMECYKVNTKKIAEVCGSRMLCNVRFIGVLCEELEKIGIKDKIKGEYVISEIIKLLKTSKLEATKSRLLELMSKITQIADDTKIQVNIYPKDQQLAVKDIMAKVLRQPIQVQDMVDSDDKNK